MLNLNATIPPDANLNYRFGNGKPKSMSYTEFGSLVISFYCFANAWKKQLMASAKKSQLQMYLHHNRVVSSIKVACHEGDVI